MSMLADRKRKQTWILNPRLTEWSKDDNKFGQKLMEKMGWSKGKGLGAKLDGVREHVRVSHKVDNSGIGFKDKEKWTEHEDDFSALLQKLSSNYGNQNESDVKKANELEFSSLEKKSESSRARLHYRKFTKGKDLSQYSEKDLANIFGKKTLTKATADSSENTSETNDTENQKEENGKENEEEKTFGIQVQNRGSMLDYFSKKMKSLKKKLKENTENCDQAENSESESDGRVGFGYASNQNSAFGNFEIVEPKHETKKRKLEDSLENFGSKNKKKKKDDNYIQGINNPAFDPLYGTMKMTKHSLKTIIKNDSLNDIKHITVEEIESTSVVVESINHSKSKDKKAKKNKNKSCETCNACDADNKNYNEMVQSESESEARIGFGYTASQSLEITGVKCKTNKRKLEQNLENDCNKKKKKKKCENEVQGICNPAFNPLHGTIKVTKHSLTTISENESLEFTEVENTTEDINDNSTENLEMIMDSIKGDKKIEKKKKKNKAIKICDVEDAGPEFCNVAENSESNQNGKAKRHKSEDNSLNNGNKKKRKNIGNEVQGISNPAFDLLHGTSEIERGQNGLEFTEVETALDKTDEKTIEVADSINKDKKKKKEKNNIDIQGITNPAFNPLYGTKEIKYQTTISENGSLDFAETENTTTEEINEKSIEVADTISCLIKKDKKSKKKKNKSIENDGIFENCDDLQHFEFKREVWVGSGFIYQNSDLENTETTEVKYECENKKKRKKTSNNEIQGISNPAFDPLHGTSESKHSQSTISENESLDFTEAEIDENSIKIANTINNPISQAKKNEKKKNKANVDVVDFENHLEISTLANISNTTLPSSLKKKSNPVQRRKSVTFSKTHEERIIPSDASQPLINELDIKKELFSIGDEVIKNSLEREQGNNQLNYYNGEQLNYPAGEGNSNYAGTENLGCDEAEINLEENISSMRRTFDDIQVKIENDLNEAKVQAQSENEVHLNDTEQAQNGVATSEKARRKRKKNKAKNRNVSVPSGNDSILSGNDSIPGGNDSIPGGNDLIPGGSDSIPSGNDSIPSGNDSIPSGNDSIPGGNDSIPGGNDLIPGGSDSIQSGNDSLVTSRKAKRKRKKAKKAKYSVLTSKEARRNRKKKKAKYGNDSILSGDDSILSGDDSVPDGNDSIPDGNDSIPSGNEPPLPKFVGEIECLEGENEMLPNGHCRLKFKHAQFDSLKSYELKEVHSAKKSYKKSIIGDVIVEFINSSMHAIKGYTGKN